MGKFAFIPTAQLSAKEKQASPISRADCKTFAAITGLKTFNSKCPLAPAI